MHRSYLHRKDNVILTAIEIVDELGIQGLSSKEIANRQGISEGTLFKHFKTKNEIILSVLDKYSQFDQDILNSTKIRSMDFKEAITYFITSYAEYYENYPAITSLVNAYEVLRWEKELENKIRDILQSRLDFVKYLVEEGKKNGELSGSIVSEDMSHIIIGFCNSMILEWRMSRYGFPLKVRILSTLDMLLKPFLI